MPMTRAPTKLGLLTSWFNEGKFLQSLLLTVTAMHTIAVIFLIKEVITTFSWEWPFIVFLVVGFIGLRVYNGSCSISHPL